MNAETFINALKETVNQGGDAIEMRRPLMTEAKARELAKTYLESNTFNPGDLVQWKPGMKYAELPEYGEPVPVLEIAFGQRTNIDKPTVSCWQEQRDLRIGVVVPSGDFAAFWFDSARFEPYPSTSTPPTPAKTDSADDMPF